MHRNHVRTMDGSKPSLRRISVARPQGSTWHRSRQLRLKQEGRTSVFYISDLGSDFITTVSLSRPQPPISPIPKSVQDLVDHFCNFSYKCLYLVFESKWRYIQALYDWKNKVNYDPWSLTDTKISYKWQAKFFNGNNNNKLCRETSQLHYFYSPSLSLQCVYHCLSVVTAVTARSPMLSIAVTLTALFSTLICMSHPCKYKTYTNLFATSSLVPNSWTRLVNDTADCTDAFSWGCL